MKKILLVLSASSLVFTSCFDEAAKTPASTTDATFMRSAAYANLAAEDMGNLAMDNGNSNSKWFGDIMARDNAMAQAELQVLASRGNVSLPATPDSAYLAMRTTILASQTFDKAFSHSQIINQQTTVTLFQNEINNGTSAEIRAYAAKYMPFVMKNQHIADSLTRL